MSEGLLSESTYDAFVAHYDLLRAGAGRYELANSCLVEITGDDRRAWLQGQVTNDVRPVHQGCSSAFCLCSATGQMLAACDLWSLTDRFLIRAHRFCLPALMERVEQMVVMEDVHGKDLTPAYRFICIQGPLATRELKEHLDLPSLDAGIAELEGSEVICLRSNRTGMGGWDLLLPLDAASAVKRLESAFPLVSEEAFQAARLEAGIPRFNVDMDTKTLPPEMGSHFESRHVSYSKGCYIGQEVLMRLHARGHTNRTWVGLVSEEPMIAGDLVRHAKRDDAGFVTSAAFSPQFGYIAGAMLRSEAAFDGELVEVGSAGAEAEVRPFPLLLLG